MSQGENGQAGQIGLAWEKQDYSCLHTVRPDFGKLYKGIEIIRHYTIDKTKTSIVYREQIF